MVFSATPPLPDAPVFAATFTIQPHEPRLGVWVVLFPDDAKLFQPHFLFHVLTEVGASAKLGIVVLGHVGLDDLLVVLPHHPGASPLAEVLIERGAELHDVVLLVLLPLRHAHHELLLHHLGVGHGAVGLAAVCNTVIAMGGVRGKYSLQDNQINKLIISRVVCQVLEVSSLLHLLVLDSLQEEEI